METGSLTKLEEYQTDADIAVMDLFGQIWGIGPAQAKRWVDMVRCSICPKIFFEFVRRDIEHWMICERKRS